MVGKREILFEVRSTGVGGRDTKLTFQLKLSSLAAAQREAWANDERTERVDAKKSKFYTN